MTNRKTKILVVIAIAFIGSCAVVQAENEYQDVVRDTSEQIVRLDNGTCVRTKWLMDYDLCSPTQAVYEEPIPPVETSYAVPDLTREDRTVYFPFNRVALSGEAKQRLDTLAGILKSNEKVKQARLVGYADRIGSDVYNQKLSQQRAQTVRDYLIAKGYTKANVTETRWVGESEPETHCPAMKDRLQLIDCLHNDRRVEVEIDYEELEQQIAR